MQNLPILLAEQIASLFFIIFMGFIAFRAKLLTADHTKILASVLLYVVTPCVIIESYQQEFSAQIWQGLLLSFGAAVLCHIIFIVVVRLVKPVFKLSDLERASIIYTNSGNLTIPLVIAVFGKEWVMYCSAYLALQTLLFWTHAKVLISGDSNWNLKRFLLNVNILSIFVGILLFVLQIKLPDLLSTALINTGNMIGPLSMIIIGIILGSTSFKQFLRPRAFFIVFLRLIVFPLLIVFSYLGLYALDLLPMSRTILTVSLLSAAAPSAVMVTQFALIYDKDFRYSSVINILSVLGCILTVPLMVYIFELLVKELGC